MPKNCPCCHEPVHVVFYPTEGLYAVVCYRCNDRGPKAVEKEDAEMCWNEGTNITDMDT